MAEKGKISKEREQATVIERGLFMAIHSSKTDLETTTRNIDSLLPEIEAREMPEYQKSIDAIDEYALAVRNKIVRLNNIYFKNKK